MIQVNDEIRGFYSKLVRLKVPVGDLNVDVGIGFLFQIGSIKRAKLFLMSRGSMSVSIPNWFD